MELTIGELRGAQNPLLKILATEQPFKLSYRIRKITKKLEEEFRVIEETRLEMVKKFANGGPKVAEENMATFNQQFKEFCDTKVCLDIQPIPMELLEEIKLSPLEVMRLEKFIEEPVAGASPAPAQKGEKNG